MSDVGGMFEEEAPVKTGGGVAIDSSLINSMIDDAYSDEAETEGYKGIVLGENPGDVVVDAPVYKKPSPSDVLNTLIPKAAEAEKTPEEKARIEAKANAPFKFTDNEIKEMVLALIKRKGYKKTYTIYEDFEVVFAPINDTQEGILNERVSTQLSKGERRTRIEIVEPYFDSLANRNVPGGRVETDYYVNADSSRANIRTEMAMFMYSIDRQILPEAIDQKLAVLATYSPLILDAIYKIGFLHFRALMAEAETDLLNFYKTRI